MNRLQDDPDFNAVFAGERLIQIGDRGPVVGKLQQALLEAGYDLPQFGADGDFGAETESAVRAFQQDSGLDVDGIVGPDTIRSLDEQSSSGQDHHDTPTGTTVSAEQALTWRNEIVRIAEEEEADWTKTDGVKKQEREADRFPKLESYCSAAMSASGATDCAKKAATNAFAWSAVFISYVVKQAGVNRTNGFEFSVRHITFTVHALANRLNQDHSRPFWLYDIDETTPEPGDILCKNRKVSGKCTTHSYDTLRNRVSLNESTNRYEVTNPFGHSHTDIIVRKNQQAGTTYIETVGGNTRDLSGVSHTVGRKRWQLDTNGHIEYEVDRNNQRITDPCSVFGLIRIEPSEA